MAFFVPFTAILAVENGKRAEKIAREQREYLEAQKAIEQSRYQYYLDIAEHKNNLKRSMADAKTQYEQLLKDQPALIGQHQKQVTQTTVQPVVTEKVVKPATTAEKSSSSSSSSSAISSKPKSSAKTKTS